MGEVFFFFLVVFGATDSCFLVLLCLLSQENIVWGLSLTKNKLCGCCGGLWRPLKTFLFWSSIAGWRGCLPSKVGSGLFSLVKPLVFGGGILWSSPSHSYVLFEVGEKLMEVAIF